MSANNPAASEVFLDTLTAYGVEDIFSSPGSEWPPVWEALVKYQVEGRAAPRYWNCRHEALSVSIGLGYTKASGRMSAQLFHSSVGPTSAAMALRTAYQELIPMLVSSGQSTTLGERGFEAIDQTKYVGGQWLRYLLDVGGPARLMEPYVKWSDSTLGVESYPSMLQHACRVALAPPQGPVFLCISFETLLNDVPAGLVLRTTPPALPGSPPSDQLDALAAMLLNANTPVIVTEEAGRDVRNVPLLVELAETLGIGVFESQSPAYLNFPRSHPLHQGFDAKSALESADLIVMISVRGPWHPPSAAHGSHATLVLVDDDVTKSVMPTWGHSADLALSGSVNLMLTGLLERIKSAASQSKDIQNIAAERRARFEARHAKQRAQWADEAMRAKTNIPIDARWALRQLSEVLPSDAIFVEECTSPRRFIFEQIERDIPGTYIGRITGGLGVGLGTALGVKVARPDELVVLVFGDGAFNYNPVLAGLGFAQEYNKPILIVIFNNQSYASMRNNLKRHYPDGTAIQARIHHGSPIDMTASYSELAKMYGGHGEQVTDPAKLESALRRGIEEVKAGRVAIVDIIQQPIERLKKD